MASASSNQPQGSRLPEGLVALGVSVVVTAVLCAVGYGVYYFGQQSAPKGTEFLFRRLVDPIQFGGRDFDGMVWLAVLIPTLWVAMFYVVWMYIRDGRSIGWFFGTFLALLRISVYAVLTILFLMPAMQVLDESITRFKVIVMFDVSGSMLNKDDIPTDTMPLDKILSRQDKVLRFLSDEQVGFLKKLNKNPVALYRFGAALDGAAQNYDEGAEPATPTELKTLLYPDTKAPVVTNEATPEEKEAARKKYDLQLMLVNGTNVPDSVLAVLKKESSTQPQGLIIISDGRSTGMSTSAVEEVKKSKVPVFAIGVGEYRQHVRIAFNNEVAVPPVIQPDMPFPAVVDVDGEGLADEEITITLHVYKPVAGAKDDDEITEEPKRKPDLEITQKVRLRPGDPPHASASFPFDLNKLPADFRKVETTTGKPELLEGKWLFIARTPKDKREIFEGKEHVTRPATMRVMKKPLRALLFAGGPNRDYQFARTLLVREAENKRAEVSIHIQNARPEVVQDVPEERMLKEFPSRIADPNDPNETADNKYSNLLQYDVILAFDPDWTKLSEEAMRKLETWVDKHRGGLIAIGGPVNTFQLTRGLNTEKVKPLLDMLPVILDDNRIYSLDRSTAEPWKLNFPGATAEMEFLKLDEEAMDQRDVLAGWEQFFTGREKADGRDVPLKRGFYDFYPVREAKTNATVIATFSDPRARLKDGKEQPYIVAMPYGSGQHNCVWIGSGEIWRLRQFKEAFHERFLVKLMRYAASGSQSGAKLRGDIRPQPDNAFANKVFRVRAQMSGKDMNPLPQTEKPQAIIKPLGVENAKPVVVDLKPMPVPAGDKWGGYFDGPVQLPAGQYSVELAIPGTSDKLYQKYNIPESNLEMDNPRPDFIELRKLTSNAKDVLDRVPEEVRKNLETELERTNRAYTKEGDKDLRLFFDLKSANLIPECMTRKPLPQISRGPVKDLWDFGFAWFGLPKVSLALMVIVGLFSIEWLTRKLLKLA
jgi:hypothetical protein